MYMPRQEIEGELSIDELENALTRVKPGQSSRLDGVAPNPFI